MRLLTWPMPALLAWTAAWAACLGLLRLGAPMGLAMLSATVLGAAAALYGSTRWRRVFIAAGFPLSLFASGVASAVSPWVWLAPLGLLLLLYPLNTWRDAPLFPTPDSALDGLSRLVPLPLQASVLDAGSGLGAGLVALRRSYPEARLHGLEWSWPLVAASRLRCPWARIDRADIWAADWSAHDLVYLFQRPESMARAWDKVCRELPAGRWLVSLEFRVPDVEPEARLDAAPGKPVWIYRVPLKRQPVSSAR